MEGEDYYDATVRMVLTINKQYGRTSVVIAYAEGPWSNTRNVSGMWRSLDGASWTK